MCGGTPYVLASLPPQPLRSIPACAGEPGPGALLPYCLGDTGLSPRVRGNRRWPSYSHARRSAGSIPACAGEPEPEPAQRRVLSAGLSPRVRGNPLDIGNGAVTLLDLGLSPRVRGNLEDYPFAEDGIRSIPSCAGEPWAKENQRWPLSVYPRVCGGTFKVLGIEQSRRCRGLSPRVRGNLIRTHQLVQRILCGSIPACAGEPYRHLALIPPMMS